MSFLTFLPAANRPDTAAFRPFAVNRMTGWSDGVVVAVIAAACAATGAYCSAVAQTAGPQRSLQEPSHEAARQQPAVRDCGGAIVARGTASRFVDGRTFMFEDGSEVRLAAIEAPRLREHDSTAGPAGEAARDRLALLAAGTEVVIKQAEQQKTDRYGRIAAYAFVTRDGAERLLQAELVSGGFARVSPRASGRACAAELLKLERAARRGKLGLWAGSYYESLDAESPADVLAQQGHFALVEGKVVSVRESGATIYVNFGRRWATDFTVTILKRNERSFTAAGLEPKKLAGRRVRVRGFIEERDGPWIEAALPEQIELIDLE